MDYEAYIIVGIFLSFGLLSLLKPDWMIRFKRWTTFWVEGAEYLPSRRTVLVYRILGVIFILLGSVVFAGVQKEMPEELATTTGNTDIIRLTSPRSGEAIESPLIITGEARGPWYFEATFPVVLTDWDGLIIAQHYAEAQDSWMTTEYVPFRAVLEFEKPAYGERGSLILRKSNASGLPEHDDALEISIKFK